MSLAQDEVAPSFDRPAASAWLRLQSERLLRGTAAIVAALVGLIVPGLALQVLGLLALAYCSAAVLFLLTTRLTAKLEDRGRLVRDGMRELQSGVLARVWPAAAVVFLLLLTV